MNRPGPFRWSRLLAAAVMALCCFAAVRAVAAPLTEVEDLIRRGTELRRKGEDATALPLYQRAYELSGGTPRTAAQLGLVETALDYRLEAETHLTEALAARNEIWINRNRAVLEQTLRGVKAGIGEVMVSGSPSGAEVVVAGRPQGKLPLTTPVRVVAGKTKVELRAPGYTAASATVMVQGQSQEHVALNLAPIPGSAPMPHLDPVLPDRGPSSRLQQPESGEPRPWGSGKIAGASLIGVGVASIAGGATLLLFDKRQSCTVPSGEDQCDRRTNTRVPGWSLIGGGAIATLVGVWVFRSSSTEVTVGMGPSLVASGHF